MGILPRLPAPSRPAWGKPLQGTGSPHASLTGPPRSQADVRPPGGQGPPLTQPHSHGAAALPPQSPGRGLFSVLPDVAISSKGAKRSRPDPRQRVFSLPLSKGRPLVNSRSLPAEELGRFVSLGHEDLFAPAPGHGLSGSNTPASRRERSPTGRHALTARITSCFYCLNRCPSCQVTSGFPTADEEC